MRKILIPLALLALAAWAATALRHEPSPWTSSSPEAIAEFEAAIEAFNRLYLGEAHDRLEAALQIDPDLALARVFRLRFLHGEERAAARRAIDEIDLETLTEREAFLVRSELAVFDRRIDDEDRILTEFAAAFPDDPYCLAKLGERAWRNQDWATAESYYRELIDKHPNWVRAQNYLGYIEMARGNFVAAKDHFRTYMFIAPDQANPYDSMGELLILVGQEREAEEMLEKGLEIRPDFCASYVHLADLRMMQGRTDEYEPIVAAASEHCADWHEVDRELGCRGRVWTLYHQGALDQAWELLDSECSAGPFGDLELLKHRLALLVGRPEVADEFEEKLQEHLEKSTRGPRGYADFARAALAHTEGVRKGIAGDFDGAADAFQRSDAHLRYWAAQEGTGIFKLYNQLNLVNTLERAGRDEEARAMLAEVAEVNPTLATRYEKMLIRFSATGG